MRVLFLGLAVPYLHYSQNLYSELIIEFHERGDDITLIAPAYYDDDVGLELENGVPVIRVKTLELFDSGKIIKGLANLLLPWQYKRALKKHKIDLNFDLVIMPTPPITLTSLAHWFKKKYGSTLYLVMRDIFPQNAIDLGLMREGSLVYNYFRKQEKKTYQVFNSIGCMSQGNIDYVLKHNPEMNGEKFHLLPNWGPLRPLLKSEEIAALKKKYGTQGKFVAIYGGNIGLPQKVENIAHLAKEFKEYKDIFFMIIGHGTRNEQLKEIIEKEKLENIRFVTEKLDAAEYFEVLQIADVGLISLSEDFTIPNIPSKALAYYNAKKPIFASIDTNTDFGSILEENDSGVWGEAGNYKQLKEKFLYLYNNRGRCEEMGMNGYNYFKKTLLTSDAYNIIKEEAGKIIKKN
ncbi:glycosyltransferase family 4 protein [Allomuricauda sp. SCSIO 65647]|uniref:glycosyltransferase family 4 protein n=1 Tax=Allomuricauda sp. SCSIO 65647 TaxID=2908843 RepID=UPI001F414F00|nr:glycosyltransferase family 4 protein [Muricauda sp. SCSIO 65647]UJH67013.1 glycosyltransferase family 4 protein [Muricauda sp. SCSIO 65647]